MGNIIGYIFYFLLAVNLIIGWRKKTNPFLLYLTLGVLILLMSYNTAGSDVTIYRSKYEHIKEISSSGFMDMGYVFLEYVFSKVFQFSFYTFKLIISSCCFVLIGIRAKYYDVNLHFLIAMYMSYLFFMDTIQFRNFIAMSIIVFSIKYLIEPGISNLIKYGALVILAATMHIVSIIFIIMPIYRVKDKHIMNKLIVSIAAVMISLSIFSESTILQMVTFAFNVMQRGFGYIETRTNGSFYAITGMHIISVILLLYTIKKRNMVSYSEKEVNLVRMIWQINCLLLITIPLLMFSVSFYRIIRDVLVLNYMSFIVCLGRINNRAARKYVYALGIATIIIIWFVVDYTILNPYDNTVEPIFLYNKFWSDVTIW